VREAQYTPGWSSGAVAFMERRTAETHAGAILPHLTPGTDLLDLGCGPGTITVGLARAVSPGRVIAIDGEASQVELTRVRAGREGLDVEAVVAEATRLPVPGGCVDAAFSHALLEHLADPVAALREVARALRPGGVAVVVSPDWGGFLLAPEDPVVAEAIRVLGGIQTANGGDIHIGRRLGEHMAAAGFEDIRMGARYEVYDDRAAIADYFAERLERESKESLAAALRAWGGLPGGMFAQAWVSATGVTPARR
jgi:SAM-dependent methyltransferase